MLKPEFRLKKVRDFNLLVKKGKWINSLNFSLRVLDLRYCLEDCFKKMTKDEFITQTKIAFTVGVKISKSAVVRNRLRRQTREVVRLMLKEKKIKNGRYLLFVAKPGALKLGQSEIEKEVLEVLKKSGSLV